MITKHFIQLGGEILDLSQAKIMGIINLSHDSFYNDGTSKTDLEMLKKAEVLLADGADILDLGAASSRPGAEEIDEKEEWERLESCLKTIKKEFPNAIISIDTYRQNIAKKSVEMGANMVNDISGGMLDKEMIEWIGKNKIPYILMHMPGKPKTMMENCSYKNIMIEIIAFFSERINLLKSYGANDIILDPGFGFGKDINQNFELLAKLDFFQHFELPVLVGISRKSMIYKTLNTTPENALNGTTALHIAALQNGAKILRVHDVKEAKECVLLYEKLNQFCTEPSF